MTRSRHVSLQVFVPFALGYFLSYLFRVINSVLAPNLAADIGVEPAALGLLTAAYLITFAACQLPLGVLLDRFGPRIIEASLLLVAAVGAFLFSIAHTVFLLAVARSLIGIGVSACLMAAFKAFVLWFPKQRLPEINGYEMAAGGLGAMVAASPVEAALAFTDWRGVFQLLAVGTVVVAAIIFWVVPDGQGTGPTLRLKDQVRDVATILASPKFWVIAPWSTLSQGTYLAIQGLWAGPWLRDVAGFDRSAVAAALSWTAVGMTVGYVVLGILAERLSRRGVQPIFVATSGMVCFGAVVAAMAFGGGRYALGLCILYGFFGTSGSLLYAVLSQEFPLGLSGRVNTTLNLLVFISAFASQWGIGAMIGLWPEPTAGRYSPEGYRAAFGILVALQVMAMVWFLGYGFFRAMRARRKVPPTTLKVSTSRMSE